MTTHSIIFIWKIPWIEESTTEPPGKSSPFRKHSLKYGLLKENAFIYTLYIYIYIYIYPTVYLITSTKLTVLSLPYLIQIDKHGKLIFLTDGEI